MQTQDILKERKEDTLLSKLAQKAGVPEVKSLLLCMTEEIGIYVMILNDSTND